MLRQTSLAALLVAAFMVPASGAQAYILAPYVGVGIGSSTSNVRVGLDEGGTYRRSLNGDFSYVFSAGFQIRAVPLIRPRIEFEYANLTSGSGDYDGRVTGYGVNGFISLPIMPIVRPYVGVGMMNVRQRFDGIRAESNTVPQYMVGFDLDIPMIPIAGSIEWRYMNLGAADVTGEPGVASLRGSVSSILAKVRVQF